MERMLLKVAAIATTDQGVFEAVISASSVDREKDIVNPDGMVRALHKWTTTGKKIPLAWNHSTKAEDIIGNVDPASAKAVNGEVVVSGWIDQSTQNGKEAWRLAKSGVLGFSFGYLILDGSNRKGGGRNINELDVFEVTATPTPMNNDTRVLSVKALKQMMDEMEDEAPDDAVQQLKDMIDEAQEFIDGEDDQADIDLMRRILRSLQSLLQAEVAEPVEPKALRRMAEEIAFERATAGVDLKTALPEPEPEPEPEPLPPAPDTEEQRRKTASLVAQLKRQEREERIPDDLPTVGPAIEPEPTPAPIPDAKALAESTARLAAALEREEREKRLPAVPEQRPEYARLHITHEEMAGLAEGQLKAVWSAAYVNDLPDSAFLYIESGGDRDPDGKTTPRSLRHFPYKDANGAIDLPHLRNALARIPQSNLPPSVKDQLTAKAQRILDAQKSVRMSTTSDGRVDDLRRKANAVALDSVSDGESLRKPPAETVTPKPDLGISSQELRKRARDEALKVLTGDIT